MALRLEAKPGADFPWERAYAALQRVPHVHLEPLDVAALIRAGTALGWSNVVLAHHQSMVESGRCFRFVQDAPPELSGTLYADAIAFAVDVDADEADRTAARAWIEKIARHLDLALVER